jgi:hypothetical protein
MGYNQQFESNDYSPDGNNAIGGNRAGSSPIFEMAIVTQVITTPTNAHDAGTIRFRFLSMDGGFADTADHLLPYARPINTLFVSLPVLDEYVYIVRGPTNISNRPDLGGMRVEQYYYMTPISIRGDINHNASSQNYNIQFPDTSVISVNASTYSEQVDTPSEEEEVDLRVPMGNDLHKTSTYEAEDENSLVMAPNLFEGDVVINGRFGQTIRLSTSLSEGAGSNWRGNPDLEADPPLHKPITIIRNGMPPESADRYVDNLETDPSAIYLTNGQYIPELKNLTPFNTSRAMDIGELFEHANLGQDVNQCILRSDRIMSIARREIYNWSERGISLATRGTISLDAGPRAIIDATEINLGSGAGDGPDDRDLSYAVRGEQLQKVLLDIINAFSTTTVVVGGVTGNLVPLPSLDKMYSEIVDGQETGLFSKKVFLE